MPREDTTVYERIGERGFRRLLAAIYRYVPDDDILGPMYPADDLPGAEQRLRDFLVFRFGGPQRYLETRGHPRLRMRHAPYPIDREGRDRRVLLMDRALEEADLPAEAANRLREFFHEGATFMINQGDFQGMDARQRPPSP